MRGREIPSASWKKGHHVPRDEMYFRINSHFLHNITNSLWCLAGWVKELARICQENMNSHCCGEKTDLRKLMGKSSLYIFWWLSGTWYSSSPVLLLGRGHCWLHLPGEGSGLAVSAFADASAAPLADSWSRLSLLYPVVLGSRGGERFMSLVICVSLIFQRLLHIWTACAQVICSQMSWGVWTNLSSCHHLFLVYSPPPHPCALCSKTTQFLVWPYLFLSENQSPLAQGWTSCFCPQHSTCILAAITLISLAIATYTAMQ